MRALNIWKTGITDEMELEERKRIMFSNGVYAIVGFTLLLFEIFTRAASGTFPPFALDAYIPILLIALSIICLFLNTLYFYIFSRIFFITCFTFLVSVLPVILNGPSQSSYFTHPFYIILCSPVLHLLFSHPKERLILFFLLTLSFLFILFSSEFLLAFDQSANPRVPLVNSPGMFRINLAILWLFINMLMAHVLKTNWAFYRSLQEQKEVIDKQGNLLQTQNEELSKANTTLVHLNDQIGNLNDALEKRVTERTAELTERNRILSDFAYMNAHLLRSPVVRIKGLVELFSISTEADVKLKVQESLLQSAEDLDQVVRSINQKLNETK